jgi:hypothetical protein
MPTVTLDLYPDSGGRYAVNWKIGPRRPWAELSGKPGNLYFSAPPPPGRDCRRLRFRDAVGYPQFVNIRCSVQIRVSAPPFLARTE